ncbi:hypothetical protein RCC89_06500 [Cytophagaceae bacterium ABcell3]|nr:hypothetical protein RCC89_06500 [Cytophagaceae bacterium ABcell3]
MLKIKIFTFYVFLKNLICPCAIDNKHNGFKGYPENLKYKVSRIGSLPEEVPESSGLALAYASEDSIVLYTHNDSGGEPYLFKITKQGKLLDSYKISGAVNHDWEDLAQDSLGNIYIGDFGNNFHKRKDLVIYKVPAGLDGKAEKIQFSYKNQEAFPPPKKERNFDCEAFYWYQDSLYLFSKNWGDKNVKLYSLSDQAGSYIAAPIDSARLGSMITAADINPDGSLFALLGYGRVYVYGVGEEGIDFSVPALCQRFPRSKQAEGLVFINKTDFIVSNEQGQMFLFEQKKQKEK